MNTIKAYISTIVSIVILAATLLPSLHAYNHEESTVADFQLTENLTNASVDCDLCDFRITNAEAPAIFSYELYIPQKETIYAISLAETVNLSPDFLFSLRAPPVVIS